MHFLGKDHFCSLPSRVELSFPVLTLLEKIHERLSKILARRLPNCSKGTVISCGKHTQYSTLYVRANGSETVYDDDDLHKNEVTSDFYEFSSPRPLLPSVLFIHDPFPCHDTIIKRRPKTYS